MPAYLDFDSSKKFRDSILNRTLQVPNGPQTFTSQNYLVHTQNDFANVDPGDVVKSTDFNRDSALVKTQAKNLADLDSKHIYENQNDYSVTDPGDVIKSTDFNRNSALTKAQTKNLADLDPEHIYENQNDFSVTDPGDVIKSTDFNRNDSLRKTQGLNLADLDSEHIYENLSTFAVKDPGDVENVTGEFNRSESLKKTQAKNLANLDPKNIYENQNDYSVVDPGDVENVPGAEVQPFTRKKSLEKLQNVNVYSPENYFILSDLRTYVKSIKKIEYDHIDFENKSKFHNIVSLATTTNYENETDLFKFTYDYVLKQNEGPLRQRIEQNILLATVGKANFLDIFSNTGAGSVLTNILTGKESLIEYNYKITVDSSLSGKVVDFLQVVAGVESPFSIIPGNYLTDPKGEVTNSLTTGIDRLLGIRTKNEVSSNPSDLMVEYMGEGQKRRLYDGLRLNKYAPNYNKSSKYGESNTLINFVNNVAEGVSNLLTGDAPIGKSYIGDDRNNSVNNVTNINNSYQLAILFDGNLTGHTGGEKNIDERGSIAGTLTWYSSTGNQYLGNHGNGKRKATSSEINLLEKTLSTNFTFRDDSILGKTQKIIESGAGLIGDAKKSHISNVIDQTSRIFKEGEQMLSRGSAVLYSGYTAADIQSGTGEEYCRVWTKDKGYTQYQDLVRKNGLIRKFKNSVVDNTFNLNIAPLSDPGGRNFEGSTNIINDGVREGFYAKKYMFSIENLAWKASTTTLFTYNDLPYCERGNNGGRVMWFPPYNLKVNEQSQAKWNENDFIGRPEPIYTYVNTTRNANISFNVIVDHPSIMNYLVHNYWKGLTDDKADELINSFFAGCVEDSIDFYSLLLTYPQLTLSELETVDRYIKGTKDKNTITKYRSKIIPKEDTESTTTTNSTGTEKKTDGSETPETVKYYFYYKNDIPGPDGEGYYSNQTYGKLFESYIDQKEADLNELELGIDEIWSATGTTLAKNDLNHLCGQTSFDGLDKTEVKKTVTDQLITGFTNLETDYNNYSNKLTELKAGLADGTVTSITTNIDSSCSAVADDKYNLNLSFRRSHSIILDVMEKIKKEGVDVSKLFSWPAVDSKEQKTITISQEIKIPFKDLGYENNNGALIFTTIKNDGEQGETGKGVNKVTVECSDKNFAYKKLKRTAPLAFYCRKSIIELTAVKKVPLVGGQTNPPEQSGSGGGGDNTIIESYEEPIANTPTIDEVKKIIMKILAECYYFKILKEDSPMVYSSLKERLQYFSPAFHSMTPEGLNERLTFLQQCVRPGDTIPVKGITDSKDMNARNTSFGPPPICVLRIGDFFHCKMVINTLNISYDDSLWDFNPEGVGMQPMIAKVDLSVSLIGGHGLEKPVERLQNALSFNFYGNTEIFDYRSTATEDRMPFYKLGIEKIVEDSIVEAKKKLKVDVNASEKLLTGNYIGELKGTKLSYDKIINEIYEYADEYIDNYQKAFTAINNKYGAKIASMFLSPTYRKNYNYEVQTSVGKTTIEMLGEYDNNKSLSSYVNIFGLQMTNKLNLTDLTSLIGLSLGIITTIANIKLNNYAKQTIDDAVNSFTQEDSVKKLEESRNKLILALDKLNFLIDIGHDATLYDLRSSKAVNFADFNKDTLYSKYTNVVNYINEGTIYFKTLFDENYDFNNKDLPMDDVTFSEFLGILWKDKLQAILIFLDFPNPQLNNIVEKAMSKFISSAVSKINTNLGYDIPAENCLILSDNNPIEFTITDENYTLSNDELKKLNLVLSLTNFSTDNMLNYYRKNG